MELNEIIESLRLFLEELNWLEYSPNDVFIHLVEELGEIGKHLIFTTGYKNEEQGHKKPNREELPREFAQAFSLFLQLCILLNIDLEEAWLKEIEIMRKRFPPNDKYK
ncbi:MAG: hypothetical protein KGD64_08345 [Candidatus Heimdallarchaeota archaeon]|nr:hypothetical protein [Candidatus Heimdallarchaeota archaeon]